MTAPPQTETWREVQAQPAIWRGLRARLDLAQLRAWITAQGVDEIWLCGARTPAVNLEVVTAGLQGQTGPLPSPPSMARAAPLSVAFAQVLAAVWSDRLRLYVDNPSARKGALMRVVSNVTLHPEVPR